MLIIFVNIDRGRSRAAATSKMEPLTIIAKLFILNVAAALDPPLIDSDILEEETCKEKDEGNEGGNG